MSAKRQKQTEDRWISIRLHPEEDDDLIEWWDALPPGEGSDTAKRALRTYIAGHAIEDPTATELARLRLMIEGLARKIEQGVMVQTSSNGGQGGLDERQAAERERKIRERGW